MCCSSLHLGLWFLFCCCCCCCCYYCCCCHCCWRCSCFRSCCSCCSYCSCCSCCSSCYLFKYVYSCSPCSSCSCGCWPSLLLIFERYLQHGKFKFQLFVVLVVFAPFWTSNRSSSRFCSILKGVCIILDFEILTFASFCIIFAALRNSTVLLFLHLWYLQHIWGQFPYSSVLLHRICSILELRLNTFHIPFHVYICNILNIKRSLSMQFAMFQTLKLPESQRTNLGKHEKKTNKQSKKAWKQKRMKAMKKHREKKRERERKRERETHIHTRIQKIPKTS